MQVIGRLSTKDNNCVVVSIHVAKNFTTARGSLI